MYLVSAAHLGVCSVWIIGTIRGDLGRDWGLKVQQNIVHGSDSPESAEREIGIWFPEL